MPVCDSKIGYISPLNINPEQALNYTDMRGHEVRIGCRKVQGEDGGEGLWICAWDRDTDDTIAFVLPIADAKEVMQMLNRELQRHGGSSLVLLDIERDRGREAT